MSLFASAMGIEYRQLHLAVRAFHDLEGHVVLPGFVEVEGPANWMGRIMAALQGAPDKAARGDMTFVLDAGEQEQVWARRFPGATMRSTMRLVDGLIVERMGPATMAFQLVAEGEQLVMKLRSMRFLGIPCPAWLVPRIVAREHGQDGRLHFEVRATVPLIGRVAGYRGYLEIPGVGA